MRGKQLTALLVVACFGLIGCNKTPEPTYKGKTVSAWIALSDDNDPKTKIAAFDALGHFSEKDPGVIDALSRGLKSREPTAQLPAAASWYRVTRDAKPVIPVVAAELRREADQGDLYAKAYLLDVVSELGPAGRPLAKDIAYAKAQIKKQQYHELDLATLDEMESAIK